MSLLKKNTNFYFRKPDSSRKSYTFVKYTLVSRSTKEYLPFTDVEQALIDNVNDLYAKKTISNHEAEARLNAFITESKRIAKVRSGTVENAAVSSHNDKIFKSFWADQYESRELVDIKSAEYDFKRSLLALNNIGVDSSVAVIKKAIGKLAITKSKRIYARLTEIRSYLEIKEKISTNKAEIHIINYISLPKLYRILANIEDDDVKIAIATLFATGIRLSELLGLTEKDLINGHLNINKQHKSDNTITSPKRNKTGNVVIIDELKDYVTEFITIEDKHALRNKIQNTIVETSNRVIKRHIHAHDLRHSHAIYLLGMGASLTLISLQLRNRIEICQKYYAGFEHTSDTLQMLKAIAGK